MEFLPCPFSFGHDVLLLQNLHTLLTKLYGRHLPRHLSTLLHMFGGILSEMVKSKLADTT